MSHSPAVLGIDFVFEKARVGAGDEEDDYLAKVIQKYSDRIVLEMLS